MWNINIEGYDIREFSKETYAEIKKIISSNESFDNEELYDFEISVQTDEHKPKRSWGWSNIDSKIILFSDDPNQFNLIDRIKFKETYKEIQKNIHKILSITKSVCDTLNKE